MVFVQPFALLLVSIFFVFPNVLSILRRRRYGNSWRFIRPIWGRSPWRRDFRCRRRCMRSLFNGGGRLFNARRCESMNG